MRIGFDATPLLGQRSGVGNHTTWLLEALLAGDPTVEYLLYSKKRLPPLSDALRRGIPVDGHLPQSTWLWMQLMMPRVIARTRPDICHFTNSLAPLRAGRPYVLTIHDASLFLHNRFHPRVRMLYRALLPHAARRAAAVITISRHARHDLSMALGLAPEKIHVVYLAAADHFRPITNPDVCKRVRAQYDLPDEFLLYVGTIEPRKNLHRLLEALHRVRRHRPQTCLVMAGPAGWLMHDLGSEIERLGLEDAVHYLGYVPAADMAAIYTLAKVFVYPSLYEGFGLPPLEAMACGTPVVCSERASMGELYSDAAWLVDPECVDSLVGAIHRLLDDRHTWEALRERGFQRASTLSWARTAFETQAVYHHVLGTEPTPSHTGHASRARG